MRVRVLVVVALVVAGCTSGHKEPQARPGVTGVDIRMQVTGADIVSPNRVTGPLDDATRDAALAVVQRLFDETLVQPALTGKVGTIDKVFTDDAAARANGPDRASFFDEGLPRVGRLVADKANVRLTALADADDKPVLVVAKYDWDVRSADGKVRIQRAGELSLIPVLGTWLVGEYTVAAARSA